MSGKLWTAQEDDVIRNNFWSMKAEDIASMLDGRTKKSVHHRAKALGLKKSMQDKTSISTSAWIDKLSEQLGEPVESWLRRRYVDEGATYRELTAEANINTRSLMRLMRRFNITPISASEAAKRQKDKDPEAFERFLSERLSPEAKRKAALTRQANWRKTSSDREDELLKSLNDASLYPEREYAVDVFNIDFAFVDAKLAVELDPRWHNTGRKAKADKKKDEFLTSCEWTVLRLDARRSTSFNVQKVVAALASIQSSPV